MSLVTAFGAVLTGLTGIVWYRANKEPQPIMTIDQLLIANTQAQLSVGSQFEANNKLFMQVTAQLQALVNSANEQVRIAQEVKILLAGIKDEAIRGVRR